LAQAFRLAPFLLPGTIQAVSFGRVFSTPTDKTKGSSSGRIPASCQSFAQKAAGHWWLATVPETHSLTVLDISDPEKPREVSRVTFDPGQKPHWIAADLSPARRSFSIRMRTVLITVSSS
jgi:hypothetical protein